MELTGEVGGEGRIPIEGPRVGGEDNGNQEKEIFEYQRQQMN